MRIRSAPAFAALLLAGASAALAQPAVSLNQPWTAKGTLEPGDARDAEQRLYDEHRIRLPQGQRFSLTATSEDFDTVIELYRPGEEEPLGTDDDSGGGFNSRLSFTPEEGGDYVLRVFAYGTDAVGAYRVGAEALPPLPPPIAAAPSATETTTWRVYRGTLTPDDAEIDGVRLDDYSFAFRAGEEVLIRAASDDFDTVVHVLRADGREGEPIATDDDGGGGLNSFLVFRPEEAGDYIVRVAAYGEGEGGAYTLRVGR